MKQKFPENFKSSESRTSSLLEGYAERRLKWPKGNFKACPVKNEACTIFYKIVAEISMPVLR